MNIRRKIKLLTIDLVIAVLIGFYQLKNNNFIYAVKVSMFSFIIIAIISFVIRHYINNKHKEKLLKSPISIVDKMTGEEFEEFLLVHFKKLNYKGKLTPVTADYGADLILKKDNEKIVVQAKRWNSRVGIEAVQQVLGAREYYNADKCIVITNNYFTINAENLAKKGSVELWNRKKLIDMMSIPCNKNIEYSDYKKEKVICPKCGAEMKIREGKYGLFYGCSNYPKCNHTKNL